MAKIKVYDGYAKVYRDESGREMVDVSDSVGVLIVNRKTDEVLFVSQYRAPMTLRNDSDGHILEAVAGHIEEGMSIKATIIKEIWEEVQITVREKQVILLNEGRPLALSPGILAERMYLAVAYTDESIAENPHTPFGNVDEGERMFRRCVPVSKLQTMVFDDIKTWALVQWFLKETARETVTAAFFERYL